MPWLFVIAWSVVVILCLLGYFPETAAKNG